MAKTAGVPVLDCAIEFEDAERGCKTLVAQLKPGRWSRVRLWILLGPAARRKGKGGAGVQKGKGELVYKRDGESWRVTGKGRG